MASAQTIAAMSVRISAQTQELQQGLEKAGGSVNKFQNMFSGMGGIGGAIAGAFAIGSVVNFGREIITLNGQVQGVKFAFDKLNQPGLLDQLRTATKGTVDDFGLMKAAVNAKNFKIPLDQLATYLTFARRRAQETGQSVDYLTESIITGLGRESPLILDNLGLSAKAISDEFKKTGNFGKAVGTIIKDELGKMGPEIETTADKIARMNASWENMKNMLGGILSPIVDVFLTKLNDGLTTTARIIDSQLIPKSQKWWDLFANTDELNGLGQTEKWLDEAKSKLNELAAAGKLTEAEFDKLRNSFPLGPDVSKFYTKATSSLYGFYLGLKQDEPFKKYKSEVDGLQNTHLLTAESLNKVIDSIDKNISGYDELTKKVKTYGEGLMKTSTTGVLEGLRKQQSDLQALLAKASKDDIADLNLKIKKIGEEIAYYEKLGTVIGIKNKLEDKKSTLEKKQNEASSIAEYRAIGFELEKVNKELRDFYVNTHLTEGLPLLKNRGDEIKDKKPLGDSTQLTFVATKIAPVDLQEYEASMLRLQEFNENIGESIKASLLDLTISVSEAFGQMMAGADVDWTGVVLGGFGDMLQQLGVQVLSAAAMLVKINIGLASMNPFLMAAAGVGLIALGAGLKAKANKIAGGGGASAGTSSMASSSVSSGVSASSYAPNLNDASKQNTINVAVTGKLQGKDLVLVMDRSNDSLKRIG